MEMPGNVFDFKCLAVLESLRRRRKNSKLILRISFPRIAGRAFRESSCRSLNCQASGKRFAKRWYHPTESKAYFAKPRKCRPKVNRRSPTPATLFFNYLKLQSWWLPSYSTAFPKSRHLAAYLPDQFETPIRKNFTRNTAEMRVAASSRI